MNILVLGAGGFIGRHLVTKLKNDDNNKLTLFDMNLSTFASDNSLNKVEGMFTPDYNFDELLKGQEMVYHLISTTVPSSNISYGKELTDNVVATLSLLDACVRHDIKRIVFISSGGTVYGKSEGVPFKEEDENYPICSYGIQKIAIEKYLYLYKHVYNLDYRIVRLANPYGPGQNPKGAVGAVTVFLDRVMNGEPITLFGDGGNVRDYIYIDDAIDGIVNIGNSDGTETVYNLGSGVGTSLKEVLDSIEKITNIKPHIDQKPKRSEDLKYSVLNSERYMSMFPNVKMISLDEGISKMVETYKK